MALVAIDWHFVRDRVENRQMIVKHISNVSQKVIILTKALHPRPFQDLQDKIVSYHQQSICQGFF